MKEMIWSLVAAASLAAGIVLVVIGNKKNQYGKVNLPMVIIGWVVIIATIIASIIGIIVGINSSEASAGTFLLTAVVPVFILLGFVVTLGLGIANLVKGYQKRQDGSQNTGKIIF